MRNLSYHRDMNKIIGVVAIALAMTTLPTQVDARIVIFQNVQPTAPIIAVKAIEASATTSSKLVTGAFYAPATRNLTEGERNTRINELLEQIARLRALIDTLQR